MVRVTPMIHVIVMIHIIAMVHVIATIHIIVMIRVTVMIHERVNVIMILVTAIAPQLGLRHLILVLNETKTFN